jgi:GMP synthase (glutamine-hydrolysing)
MQKILILDFGSQYTQLIARKIRELNVYCEIYPYNKIHQLDSSVKGVILSGSPFSVRDENAPKPDLKAIKGKLPLLGICFGAQYLAHNFGGLVEASEKREYGRANLINIQSNCKLFKGVSENSQVWMSHADTIMKLPENCEIVANTKSIDVAAYRFIDEDTFGLQFHPEVYHSTDGQKILQNFVTDICGIEQNWTPNSFIEATITDLKQKLGNDKVILGLSGGVDSTVAAVLLHKAIGKNLTCIFVDNGLLRLDEYDKVLQSYKGMGLNVVGVRAGDLFIGELAGVSDPEQKRKIIGRIFIDVFSEKAKSIENVKWLAQGTIYPDVIESVSVNGPSQTIKSHHNVGGLPEKMNLKIVEPLRLLFKDEVRRIGKALGIDENILRRHPFPGPGLAIRIIGEITAEKLQILKKADDIFISGLIEHNLYDDVWQAGVILLSTKSVGVMGDERTYEYVVALRAVHSTDGMTADWVHLPYDFLSKISTKIINQVKGINRVVYDISSKPPATIEWE